MKINLKLPAIVLGLVLLLTGTTVKAQDDNVSLQQFYDELSPYGTWIQDPQYGYVWRPDVDQSEFRPYYSNGRWVMTEYGNTWVSDYNWGWAPFHYGRWIYDTYNRWVWIPDTTWGPAWVDWRSGGGYYGWAPMGPVLSININIGRRYVRPDYCWSFIPMGNIYYSSFPRYRSYNNITIINRTTIINNTYVRNSHTYYTGPRPEEIRRATNRDVTVYQIARNNRQDAPRIDRNTVNIYSPRPSRTNVDVAHQAPKNVGAYNTTRGDNRTSNRDNNPRIGGRDNNNAPVRDGRTETAPAGRATDRTERRPDAPATRTPQTTERGGRQDRGNNPVMRTEQPAQQTRQPEPVRQQQRQDRQQSAPPAQQQPRQQSREPQVQQPRQQSAPPARTEQGRGNNGGGRESGGGGRPARGGRG